MKNSTQASNPDIPIAPIGWMMSFWVIRNRDSRELRFRLWSAETIHTTEVLIRQDMVESWPYRRPAPKESQNHEELQDLAL